MTTPSVLPPVGEWRVVALGSGSSIKRAAVLEVFPHVQVLTENVPSGVRPQPVGRDETLEGATNRARGALLAHPSADVAIGIENGMWPSPSNPSGSESSGFVDGAAIVLLPRGAAGSTSTASAAAGATEVLQSVTAPPDMVATRIAGPITGGVVIWTDELDIPSNRPFGHGREGEWSSLKDPHSVLTGGVRPRQAFIADALHQWLARQASA